MDIYVEGFEFTPLSIFDKVLVVVDFQYNDSLKRRIGEIGEIVEIDHGDEWTYCVEFSDGGKNWFKRYHLTRVSR